MEALALDQLREDLPTLTRDWGCFLSEAALYCLKEHNHNVGVILKLAGSEDEGFRIVWGFALDNRAPYSYGDKGEATEYGATCLSILVAINRTEYKTVERSCKGGGFDYWLGNIEEGQSLPFQRKARLEISGIFKGSEADVNRRAKGKAKQTSLTLSISSPILIYQHLTREKNEKS